MIAPKNSIIFFNNQRQEAFLPILIKIITIYTIINIYFIILTNVSLMFFLLHMWWWPRHKQEKEEKRKEKGTKVTGQGIK